MMSSWHGRTCILALGRGTHGAIFKMGLGLRGTMGDSVPGGLHKWAWPQVQSRFLPFLRDFHSSRKLGFLPGGRRRFLLWIRNAPMWRFSGEGLWGWMPENPK